MMLSEQVKTYISHSRIVARKSNDSHYKAIEWTTAMNALMPLMQMVETAGVFRTRDIAQFVLMRQKSLTAILPREGNFSRESQETVLNEIITKAKSLYESAKT